MTTMKCIASINLKLLDNLWYLINVCEVKGRQFFSVFLRWQISVLLLWTRRKIRWDLSLQNWADFLLLSHNKSFNFQTDFFLISHNKSSTLLGFSSEHFRAFHFLSLFEASSNLQTLSEISSKASIS